MIRNVRWAETETGLSCKVLMDLGGLKPQIGMAIAPDQKQRIFQGEHLVSQI
jgi:pyruvate kinase